MSIAEHSTTQKHTRCAQ